MFIFRIVLYLRIFGFCVCNCVLGDSRKFVIIIVLVLDFELYGMVINDVLLIVFLFKINVWMVLGNWLLVIVVDVFFGLKEIVILILLLVISCSCVGLVVGYMWFLCYKCGVSLFSYVYRGFVI